MNIYVAEVFVGQSFLNGLFYSRMEHLIYSDFHRPILYYNYFEWFAEF